MNSVNIIIVTKLRNWPDVCYISDRSLYREHYNSCTFEKRAYIKLNIISRCMCALGHFLLNVQALNVQA